MNGKKKDINYAPSFAEECSILETYIQKGFIKPREWIIPIIFDTEF